MVILWMNYRVLYLIKIRMYVSTFYIVKISINFANVCARHIADILLKLQLYFKKLLMKIVAVYKNVARKLLPLGEIIIMRCYDLCGCILLFCVSFEIFVAYVSNWADCCFWMYFFHICICRDILSCRR